MFPRLGLPSPSCAAGTTQTSTSLTPATPHQDDDFYPLKPPANIQTGDNFNSLTKALTKALFKMPVSTYGTTLKSMFEKLFCCAI